MSISCSVNVILYYRNEKGQTFFLLQKRSGKAISNPNLWAILGGRSRIGEPRKKAARREVLEEVGIRITSTRLKLIKSFPADTFPWLNIRSFFYSFSLSNLPTNINCFEGDKMEFFCLDDLVNLEMPQGQIDLIKELAVAIR